MSAFPEHVRSQWFPVALSARVKRQPLRVLLLGEPVVLARTSTGQVLALEDRCPHRGAPLSAGTVCGNALRCPYHGWVFDAAGRCLSMPGTDESAALGKPHIASYSTDERDGIIWAAREPRGPLPSRMRALAPAWQRFLWETTWNAPIIEAQENFLDALHTHLVHPGLVRRDAVRRPVTATLAAGEDGIQIDFAGQADQTGLLYRLFESTRTRERAYFSALSVGQLEYRYAAGWAAYITLCFCPETTATTRVYALFHIEGRWAPRWLVRLVVWPFLRRVASQDKRILDLQSRNLQAFSGHRHIVTTLDIVRPHLEHAWRGGALRDTQTTSTIIYI